MNYQIQLEEKAVLVVQELIEQLRKYPPDMEVLTKVEIIKNSCYGGEINEVYREDNKIILKGQEYF